MKGKQSCCEEMASPMKKSGVCKKCGKEPCECESCSCEDEKSCCDEEK